MNLGSWTPRDERALARNKRRRVLDDACDPKRTRFQDSYLSQLTPDLMNLILSRLPIGTHATLASTSSVLSLAIESPASFPKNLVLESWCSFHQAIRVLERFRDKTVNRLHIQIPLYTETLVNMCEHIVRLRNIQSLTVDNCWFRVQHAKQMRDIASGVTQLRIGPRWIPSQIFPTLSTLPELIRELGLHWTSLTRLNLLGAKEALPVGIDLSNYWPQLTCLSLCVERFDAKQASTFPRKLKSLVIWCIADAPESDFLRQLASQTCLTRLVLGSYEKHGRPGDLSLLQHLPITHLRLALDHPMDQEAASLIRVLPLRVLEFSDCPTKGACLQELKDKTTLTTLNLHESPVSWPQVQFSILDTKNIGVLCSFRLPIRKLVLTGNYFVDTPALRRLTDGESAPTPRQVFAPLSALSDTLESLRIGSIVPDLPNNLRLRELSIPWDSPKDCLDRLNVSRLEKLTLNRYICENYKLITNAVEGVVGIIARGPPLHTLVCTSHSGANFEHILTQADWTRVPIRSIMLHRSTDLEQFFSHLPQVETLHQAKLFNRRFWKAGKSWFNSLGTMVHTKKGS